MQTRTFIVLLFLALGLVVPSNAQAARNNGNSTGPLSSAQKDSVLSVCVLPEDTLPSARASLRDYFKGRTLNSVFFQDFVWVHPEYVEFARCVVCLSGFPNDPYWEAGFRLSCQGEEYTTMATEYFLEEETGFL